LKTLHVTTSTRGGAGLTALGLVTRLRQAGHDALLAVKQGEGHGAACVDIDNDSLRNPWSRFWRQLADHCHISLFQGISGWSIGLLADPAVACRVWQGLDDFGYPATAGIDRLPSWKPDLIHLHNLHGGYFDLRQLPALSASYPVVVTLHDAWLLSGHCAHSLDCERWRTGCGHCPYPDLYPVMHGDASADNWREKAAIYRDSFIGVITPSRWLMDKVSDAMLRPAVAASAVIPNGIDLDCFQPGDSAKARRELGIPEDAHVLLFAGNATRVSPWKDYATVDHACRLLAEGGTSRRVILLVPGEQKTETHDDLLQVRCFPYEGDPRRMATYYRAADLYLHAAHADTFPFVILEALACGTPVVATAVGGIVEQVTSLRLPGTPPDLQTVAADRATGVLVAESDAAAMADAIRYLMDRPDVRLQLAANARAAALLRFGLDEQIEATLSLYATMCRLHAERQPADAKGQGKSNCPC